MKYIYINEEGRVGVSHYPPTYVDLAQIADGTLQVLEVSIDTGESEDIDYAQIVIEDTDADGLTLPLPEATMDHEPDGQPFHLVP